MSSLPVSGIRLDRSLLLISWAVSLRRRSGASSRPACQAANAVMTPSESSADDGVGPHQAVQLTARVVEEGHDNERALIGRAWGWWWWPRAGPSAGVRRTASRRCGTRSSRQCASSHIGAELGVVGQFG